MSGMQGKNLRWRNGKDVAFIMLFQLSFCFWGWGSLDWKHDFGIKCECS